MLLPFRRLSARSSASGLDSRKGTRGRSLLHVRESENHFLANAPHLHTIVSDGDPGVVLAAGQPDVADIPANLSESQMLPNETQFSLSRRGTGASSGGTLIIALDVVVLVLLLGSALIVLFMEFRNRKKQEVQEKEEVTMVAMQSMNQPDPDLASSDRRGHVPAAPSVFSDVIVLGAPTSVVEPNANMERYSLQFGDDSNGDSQSIRPPPTPGDPVLPHDDSLSISSPPASPTSTSPESVIVRSPSTPTPFLSLDPYSGPLGELLDLTAQWPPSRPNSSRIHSRTYSRSNYSNMLSRHPSSSSFLSHGGGRSLFAGFSGSPTPYDEPALSDTRSDVLATQLSRSSSMATLNGSDSLRRDGSVMPQARIFTGKREKSLHVQTDGKERRDSASHEVPPDAPVPSPAVPESYGTQA